MQNNDNFSNTYNAVAIVLDLQTFFTLLNAYWAHAGGQSWRQEVE